MIAKILSGIPFLDRPYGGVFSGRSVLVCGRSGTGKSTAGFQFVHQGLRQDNRCLILSTMAANDLTILAESMGFSFSHAIDRGQLILLEYESFIPGRGVSEWDTLPPEAFNQLREIIETNSITRLVLDTVLPWVALPRGENLSEHAFSFVRSCDRLGVTTLMTIPKPVSSLAFRLKKALENVIPICVLLSHDQGNNRFLFQTTKFLGEKNIAGEMPYTIEANSGLTPVGEDAADASAPSAETTPIVVPAQPAVAAPPPPAVAPDRPIRFSSVFTPTSDTPHPTPPPKPAPPKKDNPARLAAVWKPDLDSRSDGQP